METKTHNRLLHLAWGCLISIVILFFFLMVREGAFKPSISGGTIDAVPAAVATTVKPPAPPACIHEHCADRPVALQCVLWMNSGCTTFNIRYERHCDCDQWETVL